MKYSWNAKTPMTFPDMVAKPIKWNPMSEDWKKRVEAMQLYNEDATAPWLTNEMKKTLRALRDRILTFGGDEVLLNTRDEDAEKVLERGQFFYGSKYMKKGEDCRCHQNAAYLWDANRGRCQMRADGGTPTAEALAYMLNRLEKRSEPSKILFVVTDGNSNNKAYLPMLLAEAKRNHIMVIAAGIGACRQSIHSEFPENFLDISDMNSMPRNICNIIKRKLVK